LYDESWRSSTEYIATTARCGAVQTGPSLLNAPDFALRLAIAMSALGSLEIHPIADDEYHLFVPPLFGTMGMAGFVAGLYPNNNTKEGLQSAEERFKIEKFVSETSVND
jgi:hypothetical protein